MADKIQIDRTLVLSTAHITLATSRKLDDGNSDIGSEMPSTIVWECYGYFVWADDTWHRTSPDAEAHPDLVAVIALAVKLGCQWVRLDSDGPQIAELPTYDWDEKPASIAPGAV